jgi:hypothetical protein
MKILAPLLALMMAAVPAASLAAQADAFGQEKKGRQASRHIKPGGVGTRVNRNPMGAGDVNGYQEHLLEKVPFGSRRWWTIYEGEPLGR